MSNIFVIAAVVSIVFLIAKFIEMRFVEKENKPLKILIRDALVVYFSVVSGYFILSQLDPVTSSDSNITPIFTDNPGF
jgi:TctA family transporter